MNWQAKPAKSVDLRARLDEPGARVLADRDRLDEALGNLVGNAVKYTPRGGAIVVAAEAAPRTPSPSRAASGR